VGRISLPGGGVGVGVAVGVGVGVGVGVVELEGCVRFSTIVPVDELGR